MTRALDDRHGRLVSPSASPIRTQGLTKVFKGAAAPAVDGLDLEVAPGEIFGLLGPNGAGKTTTIGMLTTRVVPTSGHAWVAGVDVVAHPVRTKQIIGVVPQVNTLDRSLSVEENLYFHGRYFGVARDESRRRTRALLERFRLADRHGSPVDTLSGGMAQRLMVARAMLHEPAILFLDEPTTGLDPQARLALWDLLRDLNGAGQTILLTTHYMDEADVLCDRVAIMDNGRILALDTPARLKRSVEADTVVRLSSDEGDQGRLVAAVGDVAGVSHVDIHDAIVRVFADGAAGLLPRLLAAAEAGGVTVTDLSVSEPTLETVFISLTGKDLRE